MATEYDLVVLGGGPGGYVAAIRGAQLGLKTAIVEKKKLGGTCLHQGCIPTKAFLRSAEVYATMKKANEFGVMIGESSLDFSLVQERKETIITNLYKGILHLMKQGKIDVYEGHGRMLGPSIFSPLSGAISIEMNDGSENEILIPKNVILATGSRPKGLGGLEVDGNYVLTSDDALKLESLPASILIIGGGVIGVEWASMLADFGVAVTILEYSNRLLPLEDEEISKELTRIFKKKKIKVITGAEVLPQTVEKGEEVKIKAVIKGVEKEFNGEKILLSVGRQGNIENIGIENTEIVVNNGIIETTSYYQTKEAHIYAIGDVVGGLQLAHVASAEGIIAVEHMVGKYPLPLQVETVPKCVYSHPEIASVGLTEQDAVKQGYKVKTGKFSFRGIGKALVYGEVDGFVKIIVNEENDDLLGVHMIGTHVTDMISEATLAKVVDATAMEIGKTIHPHPSLSEVIGEAALAVEGKAIHS